MIRTWRFNSLVARVDEIQSIFRSNMETFGVLDKEVRKLKFDLDSYLNHFRRAPDASIWESVNRMSRRHDDQRVESSNRVTAVEKSVEGLAEQIDTLNTKLDILLQVIRVER